MSVIIVSYNVRDLLATCLLSLDTARAGLEVETIVIDNASSDGSAGMVRQRFPGVHLIASPDNPGFARANNLGLKRAKGRYLMLLNPDTILRDDSLSALVTFLDTHPKYGAAGPKLLNADGSYQPTGKRSVPTPWSSFTKLSGLSRLFPRSRLFNEYELGYLHEDQQHEIGALCGAAMLVRREAYEKAGGLDEDYFMFGEDIAWCDAIRREGFKIGYAPSSKIMHIKGQSALQDTLDRERHFFDAMKIFYRKRMQPGPMKRRLLDLGVAAARFASKLQRNKRRWRQPLFDLLSLSLLVWVILPLLVHAAPSVEGTLAGPALILTPVLLLWLLGAYRRPKARETLRLPFYLAALAIFAFSAATGYFLSGLDKGVGLFMLIWAGFGWVLLAGRRVSKTLSRLPKVIARSVIAGPDDISRAWMERQHEEEPLGDVWGWALWGKPIDMPGDETIGLPVVARVEELPGMVKAKRVREVYFSAGTATYTQILTFLELTPLVGAQVAIVDESSLWPEPPGAGRRPKPYGSTAPIRSRLS